MTFRIAFPVQTEEGTPAISPDADHVLLRFAGAQGTVNLRWDIERPAS